MIRKALAGLILLPLLLGAAAAAERPVLRTEAVVNDRFVRIGDLIENAGVVANVPIFRAPALGQTGTVSAAQVIEAVRAHALVGLDPGPVSEITVTRASRTITPAEVQTLVTAELAKVYRLGSAADVSISFDRPLRALNFEPGVTGAARVEQLRFDSRSGHFDGALTIAGEPYTRIRLAGTAIVTADAVELLRPVARGEMIKNEDVTLRRVPRAQITSETLTDLNQAIGLAARGAINPGRPLRTSELMKPQLVERNENVTLVYQVPGVLLAIRGKATEGGAEGDMIDVLNVQSKRTIRGTIIGPAQVAVAPISARIMAAAEISPTASQPRTVTKGK
jgi:flagella basal body P-ring formation protein FlgA